MQTQVTTLVEDGRPGREHLERFREALGQFAMPVQVDSPYEAQFQASVEALHFGSVAMLSTVNSTITVDRTTAHIRRGDPEAFMLLVNLSTPQRVAQDRDEVVLEQGDMVLIHSSLVSHCESHSAVPRQRGLIVLADPAALELPATDLSRLVGLRLAAGDGVGGLVSGYLERLSSVGGSLEASDALRLSSATLDLLSVMLARRLSALTRISPERRDRERLIRIQRFMRQNLGDPDLTPAAIASAHHISVRTLHRLFQQLDGSTVSRWLRERRLERYRTDLLDPALRGHSVYSLAVRWGFTDASHVSRVFKSAYGLSPAAYRSEHGRGRGA